MNHALGFLIVFLGGVLGGFTTFSTFTLETVLLGERGQVWAGAGYVLGTAGLAILGLSGGLALVRAVLAP